MDQKFIQITGKPLLRDGKSHACVSTDLAAKNAAAINRHRQKSTDERINKLEIDVKDIKNGIQEILTLLSKK